MRVLIGVTAAFVSIFFAYIRYQPYKSKLRCNLFYFELSNALVHNNFNEMKPFCAVFEEIYTKIFTQKDINTTEKALEIIENELTCAENGSKIAELIKRWLGSGEGEISGVQDELLDTCKCALNVAKKELNESGKSGFVLYPGAVLIALIILI